MFKKHKYVIVCCMDFRLHRDVDRWMKKNRLVGDCDIV